MSALRADFTPVAAQHRLHRQSVSQTAAIQHRTIPSAIFVKPYAVDHFNRICRLLTDGLIDEATHSEIILEHVQHRRGMTSSWESLEVEVTGRQDGYLVEIRRAGNAWWVEPSQIIRVAVKQSCQTKSQHH
jgi:hypothetical protein